jgi:hypothetical protein
MKLFAGYQRLSECDLSANGHTKALKSGVSRYRGSGLMIRVGIEWARPEISRNEGMSVVQKLK